MKNSPPRANSFPSFRASPRPAKFIPLLAAVALIGCATRPPHPASRARNLSGPEVTELLSKRFATGKDAVFISRDGETYGMDSDSEVSFERKGRAVLGEHGFAYQGYGGTYRVADDGTISLTLKGYLGTWPEMKMAATGDATWLYTKGGEDGFIFGGRGGAVTTSRMKPFWPFRLVENAAPPTVTPIWTRGSVMKLTCPKLPRSFQWSGDQISFRLDAEVYPSGKAVVQKYWTMDTESRQYEPAAWQQPALEAARKALENWTFDPVKQDGKPVKMLQYVNFEISKIGNQVRWVIKNDAVVIFDSMGREGRD